MYLHSSSELQRISLSASKVTKAHCALMLPPNARSYPAEEEEAVATTSEEHEEIIVEGKAETEGETQSSQPVDEKEKKTITENGSVGSPSELFNILHRFIRKRNNVYLFTSLTSLLLNVTFKNHLKPMFNSN